MPGIVGTGGTAEIQEALMKLIFYWRLMDYRQIHSIPVMAKAVEKMQKGQG